MTAEAKDWKPGVGGGIFDDLDATIIDAWFGDPPGDYTAQVGGESPAPFLYLKLESMDLERPMEQGYSCGKQWEIAGGGKEVVNTKNIDTVAFNISSRAGMLASRMTEVLGNGTADSGCTFMAARGRMNQAESYVGLSFHWKQEAADTPQKGVTSNVLLPTKFLSESSKAKAEEPSAGISDEDIATIIQLAPGKTEKELKAAILANETLSKNNTLKTAVFNKGLIAKLVKEDKLVMNEDIYV